MTRDSSAERPTHNVILLRHAVVQPRCEWASIAAKLNRNASTMPIAELRAVIEAGLEIVHQQSVKQAGLEPDDFDDPTMWLRNRAVVAKREVDLLAMCRLLQSREKAERSPCVVLKFPKRKRARKNRTVV